MPGAEVGGAILNSECLDREGLNCKMIFEQNPQKPEVEKCAIQGKNKSRKRDQQVEKT